MNSVVYHIKEGKGYTLIDGVRFDWAKGDYLVIPTWAVHEHVNTSETEEAILFSTNDIPIFERMELQKTEEYTETGGYQAEIGQFYAAKAAELLKKYKNLKENKAEIKAIVKADNEANDYIAKNPEESKSIVEKCIKDIAKQGLDKDIIESAWQHIQKL